VSKRLKGSELGYHGKGVPDPETLADLQQSYRDAMIGRGLPPQVLQQYIHLLGLEAKARRGNSEAKTEAGKITKELEPILHFNVNEVDWNN
jgi:hypothetical protein